MSWACSSAGTEETVVGPDEVRRRVRHRHQEALRREQPAAAHQEVFARVAFAVPFREVEHATATREQDDGGRIAGARAEQDEGDRDAVPGRDGDDLLGRILRAGGRGECGGDEQGDEQKESDPAYHGGSPRLSRSNRQFYIP
ncbi:MAG: hypothetical protein IH904_00735 [Proteobacteria bacterium]|nr:hypothetical protein [Pseudomonadota bacterium]